MPSIELKVLEEVDTKDVHGYDARDHVVELTLPSGRKTKLLIPVRLDTDYQDVESMTFGLNLVMDGHYE
ncbi:hypothetical protein COPG_00020 [Colwellia phage 9A]|uniref:Uncharacterized protein n=1 Tax=Colwellia phage 9A TaxID=765765 RepID=I3UMA1_9CAUD|nr:hypothetical protein COPG_00020 [Colwellia phage 9A]AFK66616.1 hypothetical protein COPG_00020 [Colwellia phage 9A]